MGGQVNIAVELVKSRGHVNVSATHRSTIEITRDDYLTPLGDCIVGVKADKALIDFSEEFKRIARADDSVIIAVLITRNNVDVVIGRGSKDLVLNDDRRIIIRKSSYIDDATIMINANKAAIDLSRSLIDDLVKGSFLYVVFIALRITKSIR